MTAHGYPRFHDNSRSAGFPDLWNWRHSDLLTFAGALAAASLLLVLSMDVALAQSVGGAGLEPIDNAAKQLERFLRGPFAKTVMAIAIALTGYVCATGRAPWFWFGLCIIACALIFGAPKIVEFFSQGAN